MKPNPRQGMFAHLKSDFPASIIVFLVALPLCLGIALASGAPLFSGIIAGIVGGIVVASLSGSPLGVSGPAAGLAIIVLNSIQELGAFDAFLLAVVIAGIIQIILGFLKAGIIGYYFPSSVIKGMLSGIGIIIILKQIPHAMGYDKDAMGDFSYNQIDGHTTFSELFYMLEGINPAAMIVTVVSLIILILWEQPFMKKIPLTRIVQGPLVVVSMAIGLNLFFQNSGLLKFDADELVTIPVAASIESFIGQFTLPDFSQITNPDIYVIALTVAVVASLETLLCVEATDKLDPQKRVTPTNKELIAQGVGNTLSGLIGGLPVTQVIVRSSANIQSGGKTKLSAILHGFFILISIILIPRVLNLIPLSALAAILFVVGYKLAKPTVFKAMYKKGMPEFVPFMVTILGIIRIDMLVGIGLGLVVAIIWILYNNYKIPYHFDDADYRAGEPIRIHLAEEVSFLNKAPILRSLKHLPDDSTVIIDASKTKSIHPDVLEIIDDFEDNAKTRGITVALVGLTHSNGEDPVKLFSKTVSSQNEKVS
ncbi:SulP family inorganic anion transporter [Persicobacter sp. CCB-QB2]|uniref:SulP family inorganic anion transporter n=1 Tax=Persicobacter sp. CCB-QB2 TaxID=1561025 RepID=UPI0006A9D91D|nr:SulP family inorganic anion transporter [Persicobacter sp. CCB-QB2]